MQERIRNIFFVVGLAAIVVMLLTFDVSWSQLWDSLNHAGYWVAAIVVLWTLLYAMNTLTWRIILSESGPVPVGFWWLMKVTITGFALNYATPVGLLGGEPYKIMELQPHVGVQRATSSVVLFAMMHIFSHFWYWLTGILLWLILKPVGVITAILLTATALFCAVGIYFFLRGYRHGMAVALVRWMGRVPGLRGWASRFAARREEDLHYIDAQIASLHSQSRRTFYLSLLLEYAGRMAQSLEIMFLLVLLGAPFSWITYADSVLILAFTSLFANMLFFIPLQLGGREGGFAMSTAQLGLTGAAGLFVSIIVRVRELFFVGIGILIMKIGNSKSAFWDNVRATMKSQDTEGRFELMFTRAPGYVWALFFRRLHVHPIAVTLLSIVLGAASAFFFVRTDLSSNLIAVGLLIVANQFDCADGQLARMTGQKTLIGRVLDGFAGDVWFQCIYVALALRLTPTWGIWGWLLGAYAGYWCHVHQANLADYYRNQHLYFQLGRDRSELDRSRHLRVRYESLRWLSNAWFEKLYLFFYIRYTLRQEHMTPRCQQMLDLLEQHYADDLPDDLRQEFVRRSRPLMPACQALTFDLRIAVLYLSALLNCVWVYFLFEGTVLQLVFFRVRRRHEQLCSDITRRIIDQKSFNTPSPS